MTARRISREHSAARGDLTYAFIVPYLAPTFNDFVPILAISTHEKTPPHGLAPSGQVSVLWAG
jgi:hypothetical protein